MKKRNWLILLLLSLSLLITACSDVDLEQIEDNITDDSELIGLVDDQADEGSEDGILEGEENFQKVEDIDEDGSYTSREDVALYIKTYGKLPKNFISKREAQELGWNPREANLWDLAEGKSIGGDRFGNREGLLPEAEDRQYYECDIDYDGGYRGAKRIVYSNDGLIYYTEDHYNSFELIYGDE